MSGKPDSTRLLVLQVSKAAAQRADGARRFHDHLDICAQCRRNPTGLCETGYNLLVAAVVPIKRRAETAETVAAGDESETL